MKHFNIIWILAIILINSSIVLAERVYTCTIDEGLECRQGLCVEKYSNGANGILQGVGTDYWGLMRFRETTCTGLLEFENSTTKNSQFYWYISSCNTEPSYLKACRTNTNGDASIEYCTDASVLQSSSSCSNTEDNFESEQDHETDCDLIADDWGGDECTGSTCHSPVTGSLIEAATNDNESLAVFLLDPSGDQTTCNILGNPKPFLAVTVDSKPQIKDCPDDYTVRNSNGSDVFIDLWGDTLGRCHEDTDDDDIDNTYTIYSESNAALIDCSITSNQFISCSSPAENQTGYTDIVVRVTDGYYTSNDTVRVYVNPKNDVSVYINDTEVWSGLSSELSDVDILEELQSYLKVCKSDSEGNCRIPIKVKSNEGAANFSINNIDINYNLRELEFSNLLQDYADNNCLGIECSVPIKLSLGSEGKLNLSDLQIYYTEKQLEVSDLSVLYQNDTNRIFGFSIKNFRNMSLDNVLWELNTGESVISATISSVLQTEEKIFVYVYYNYTTTGQFTLTATANRNSISDSESINIVV